MTDIVAKAHGGNEMSIRKRFYRECDCAAALHGSCATIPCDCAKSLAPPEVEAPKPEIGQWIGFDGGECPVHLKSTVDVVWHNVEHGTVGTYRREAGAINWQYVIRYRVAKEYREPCEFWAESSWIGWVQCPKDTYGAVKFREVIEDEQ